MADPTEWMQPPPRGTTQAQEGAFTYWMHCMVCHGDQGQGLAIFRLSYPKQDQNCGSTKCHGGPHPGSGFSFPDAPAILGTGTMARFTTASDLHNFISMRMPYQAPGTLSKEEYWNIVAYLLRQRGTLPQNTIVDDSTAKSIPIHSQSQATSQPLVFAAAGTIGLAIVGIVLFFRTRRGLLT